MVFSGTSSLYITKYTYFSDIKHPPNEDFKTEDKTSHDFAIAILEVRYDNVSNENIFFLLLIIYCC